MPRELPPTQRCECGEKIVVLKPDGEVFDKLFSQTIEIGEDVLLVGSSPAYRFEPTMGYAFQPLADGTAQLAEVLVLHRCMRKK